MVMIPSWLSRDRLAVLLGVLAPLAVVLMLVPFRDDFSNTNAALILVLVIVGVAANGDRLAGLLAALSAAVWFDFFLTQPYQAFTINDRDDIETTLLLLAVGAGVTEIALWGRRQQARADREARYLAGIRAAVEAVASPGSADNVIDVVKDQLTQLLGLRDSQFQYGTAGLGRPARLRHDGRVEWKGRVWDVDRDGLPTDTDIELLVESSGRLAGRFLLAAAPNSRPTVAQRLVAVTLADKVGSVLQ
jgi:K+-sensing histidine kinase KdpD